MKKWKGGIRGTRGMAKGANMCASLQSIVWNVRHQNTSHTHPRRQKARMKAQSENHQVYSWWGSHRVWTSQLLIFFHQNFISSRPTWEKLFISRLDNAATKLAPRYFFISVHVNQYLLFLLFCSNRIVVLIGKKCHNICNSYRCYFTARNNFSKCFKHFALWKNYAISRT